MVKRVPIGEYCEKKISTLQSCYDGLIDYVDISSVDNEKKKIVAFQTIESQDAPSRAKQLLKTGDILVSTVRPNLNAVAVVENETENLMVASTGYCVLRCDDNIDVRYLFNFCQSPYFVEDMTSQATGASYPAVSTAIVRNSLIPDHSIDEQHEIATRMDTVSNLISLRKQQLSKLDELVKSRFIEMFGDLERTTTIGRYISELRGGKSLAGIEPCKNKVLKTGAATFGWFDPEQYKYLPTAYEPLPEHKVETGDVIISRMNTPELVGACSYVFDAPEDMYYPDRLWKAVLKENTNPIFLWQLLWDRDIRKAIKESSGGTSGTMHNISKANLLAIKCMDAPIELQNEYAEFVKQTDKSKSAIQASLDKLELLKKSLMQQYFG